VGGGEELDMEEVLESREEIDKSSSVKEGMAVAWTAVSTDSTQLLIVSKAVAS